MIYLCKHFIIQFHFLAFERSDLLFWMPSPVTVTLFYHEDTYHDILLRIRVHFKPKNSKLSAVTIGVSVGYSIN